jgi:aspartokinase-like uncharacterized kinase
VSPHTVVKVGGALLNAADTFAWAVRELTCAPRDGSVLVVPGGGPFADAVRVVDQRLGLSDSAAHWAAVLAMNQYAHVLATHLPHAVLVETLPTTMDHATEWSEERSTARPAAERSTARSADLPILAPYAWLRCTDRLPHSWDVTSDSIAAHVARATGARRLILMKLASSVDPYFEYVAPPGCGLETEIVLAGQTITW